MKRLILLFLVFSTCTFPGCIHGLSMHSVDGVKLSGRYRFARGDTGLMEVTGSNGEILTGSFMRVSRTAFVDSYKKIFGSGSIAVEGPDVSAYALGGLFGSSYALTDHVYGETFNRAAAGQPAKVVRGPLFYWTASLRGERGTKMGCYLIGSSNTGRGVGRCKSDNGKEYTVEF